MAAKCDICSKAKMTSEVINAENFTLCHAHWAQLEVEWKIDRGVWLLKVKEFYDKS